MPTTPHPLPPQGKRKRANRRPRAFEYRLRENAIDEVFMNLAPHFTRRIVQDDKWVVNCEEIARQGGLSPNSITELKAGKIRLSEQTMSALVGVAISHGMTEEAARRALFIHVDLRNSRQRGLRIAA